MNPLRSHPYFQTQEVPSLCFCPSPQDSDTTILVFPSDPNQTRLHSWEQQPPNPPSCTLGHNGEDPFPPWMCRLSSTHAQVLGLRTLCSLCSDWHPHRIQDTRDGHGNSCLRPQAWQGDGTRGHIGSSLGLLKVLGTRMEMKTTAILHLLL